VKIRSLCASVHKTVLHEYWQKKRKGSTTPKDLANIAWKDRDWQAHIKKLKADETFDTIDVLRRYFVTVMHDLMKTERDEWGVRCWEAMGPPGKGHIWKPTMGQMTVDDWATTGQQKQRQARRLHREGQFDVEVANVCREVLGLAGKDIPDDEQYVLAVTEARKRLAA